MSCDFHCLCPRSMRASPAGGCFTLGFHYVAHHFEVLISCALFETTQDLLSDLYQSLQLEENAACGSGASARMGEPGSSLLTPVCSSTQLLILGKLCTSSTSCNTKTSSAPCDTNQESFLKAHSKTDEACDQNTSYHCKMGSWWKQDVETRRASFRLSASTEPGAAIKAGDFWGDIP